MYALSAQVSWFGVMVGMANFLHVRITRVVNIQEMLQGSKTHCSLLVKEHIYV